MVFRRVVVAVLAFVLAATGLVFCHRSPRVEGATPPSDAFVAATDSGHALLPAPAKAPDAAPPFTRTPLPSREQLLAPFRGTAARGFVAATATDGPGSTESTRAVFGLPGGVDDGADRPVLVASFTKLWTAVAVLRLVERRELALESTIADILPELSKRPWADSTLRELLTHTSRVPEFDEKGGYYARTDVDFTMPTRALASHVPPHRTEHRGQYKYKNAEFAILGAILSTRAGLRADDALGREVFLPAGMTHAGLLVTRGPPDLDLVPLGRIRAQNFFTAGAGYASPTDLLAFFDALAGTKLLDAASKATLFDGVAARGQGALGCWAAPFGRGDGGSTLIVERPGAFGNVRLFSAFFPEEGRAVVAWTREPLEMGRARARRGVGYALARALVE